LITGACEDITSRDPPNGLQLHLGTETDPHVTDTLVMSNLGYFQLKAAPGVWQITLAPGPSSEVYEVKAAPALLPHGHSVASARRFRVSADDLVVLPRLRVIVSSFDGQYTLLIASKRKGMETAAILDDQKRGADADGDDGVLGSLSKWWGGGAEPAADGETVHIFSLASGHLYERFLKIMMQSVLERTTRRVKFWLLKNFLSPAFIGALPSLAESLGFEYGLVQYQWPTWLHKQTNKQRIIWGYKILFLDVMFPLDVRKIIYIDADQARTFLIWQPPS
jgi:UDP-glucose:glycoprotein glucosyltransferase